MWKWILSVIFLALVWVSWFLLSPETATDVDIFPLWVAVAITAVVVTSVVGWWLYKRYRARRAARALEKAIAQQAEDEVAQAAPEDRAEVQALQRQMTDGLKALKSSRLGEGDSNPLYSLPWYAIVGPPGAGKTTALRHSGLSFPYLGSDGGAVKGAGGTRNCDWWFTNEAILLDTAGRYTTETDDQGEWLAFLRMLRTHRAEKPLNGAIVAVSVSELIDASEEQIQRIADRVRDRIDEMQSELQMVLPVYVLFTKCDLIAGFAQFFGDFKRSERSQPWGTTFALGADKSHPGALFQEEFDLLVDRLHQRTIDRMASNRPTEREKERVFQFPLEFAAVKGNLSEFMEAAFSIAGEDGPERENPILRGFYFTSGVQEGRPLDRVVGAMGRAFGLRSIDDEPTNEATDSKSFFLRDVFQQVIFKDKDVAGKTRAAARGDRIKSIAIAAATFAVAALLLIPAIFSYFNNRALVAETKQISERASTIEWSDTSSPASRIDQVDELRAHLEKLGAWENDGVPINMRWGMYQGDKLYEAALEQYMSTLRYAFVMPTAASLKRQLNAPEGASYAQQYDSLKAYLLLNDPEHLAEGENVDQQVQKLSEQWADQIRVQNKDLPAAALRARVRPHVRFYVGLQEAKDIDGEELDDPTIASARARLGRTGTLDQLYERFVTRLIDVREADPDDETGADRAKYPPVKLPDLFEDRREVLELLRSKEERRGGAPREVRGPYTTVGRTTVLAQLKDGYEILKREQWVVPLSKEEKSQGAKIRKQLKRVRIDYDDQYIREWKEFFRDIDVAVPRNNRDAIRYFSMLSTPEWPYARLLKVLRENTQFADAKKDEAEKRGGVIDQVKRRVKRKVDAKLRVQGGTDALSSLGLGEEYRDPIPPAFAKMVEFGFPESPKEGEPPPPAALSMFAEQLEQLAAEMTLVEGGPAETDASKATDLFRAAVKDTEKNLLSLDKNGQDLMRDLLMNPLHQSYDAMVKGAAGASSGLWESAVWPAYRDTVRNRYPFNSAARRDASLEDAVAFFDPKGGVLWGFYDENLKSLHRRVGHKFIPQLNFGRKRSPFTANLYNCLERAHEVTDALFSQGSPKVKFRIHMATVSPVVSEVTFELDGQKKIYRNERSEWIDFEWPGAEGPPGAVIRIRGAGGLNEEIRRDGPWGLFRLMEAGKHGAVKDNDKTFRVSWDMAGPPVQVKMQIRPTRGNHPFAPNFFRRLNCPASIGDTFGG